MNEIEKKIQAIEEQERSLQFDFFDSDTALTIGLSLVKKAKAEKKMIAIDINKSGHLLFHYAFSGTSPDNYYWIERKRATVSRFLKSSLYIGLTLKKEGVTIEERYNISSSEYTPSGGAFPITIKNTGVIGAITVSGLTEEEDHDMVVWAVSNYLKHKK